MAATTAMVPYDPKAAVFWSNLVEAAYSTFDNNPGNVNPQPPAFPAGWSYVATLQVDLQLLGTYYFIGWILRGSSGQYAVVYLGTEDFEWLYDGDAWMSSHPLGGYVESGMYDMYRSLGVSTPAQPARVPFSSFLATLDTSMPITLTGHSLGGALTTYTAADIALLPTPPAASNLQIYSIASPRVGDQTFVNAFNKAVINNFRIYNIRDYVPTLPPEDLGYVHVNTALPQPELDSWQYPIYHGWDPARAADCYHSHAGYNYMLMALAGMTPNTGELGTCYAPQARATSVQFSRAWPPKARSLSDGGASG